MLFCWRAQTQKGNVMKNVTKKFNCDLSLDEFKEVDKAVRKYGEPRRKGLLNLIRGKDNADNVLENAIEKAQKEINEAYQTVSDLYVDVAAILLLTDKEKAVELLKIARDIKAPKISLE